MYFRFGFSRTRKTADVAGYDEDFFCSKKSKVDALWILYFKLFNPRSLRATDKIT